MFNELLEGNQLYHKSILSFLAIPTLSAWGGSSTGSSSFAATQQAFDDRVASAIAMAESYEDAGVTTNMPVSGSATYTGVAVFAESPVIDISDDVFGVGDVTMAASFNATGGSISGSISNILNANDDNGRIDALSGSLAIESAGFTGNTFSTTVSGRLTDSEGPVDIAGTMQGAFVGDGGAASAAFMELTDSDDDFTIYGGLIAEKD